MPSNTIPVEWFIEAAQVFHWAYLVHFVLWFTGQTKARNSRCEKVLKRLAKRGKLRRVKYGKRYVYALPRKSRNFNEFEGLAKIAHGLACTECIVRFFRSNMEGVVIAQRFFYGLGCVPEFGIKYPTGKMLLCEFSTKSNFLFTGLMRGKLSAYIRRLANLEEKFQAKAIVVFVINVPRDTVKQFVGSLGGRSARSATLRDEGDGFPLNPFFFVDYQTFKQVPIGQQITAPIYIWCDGKEYPLKPKW